MSASQDGYQELLAKWVLQEIAPESVPDLAVSALERGCDQIEIALLAGLRDPTYGEVDELVNRLLSACGRSRPSPHDALKIIVDAEASRIVSGEVDPFDGASRIWSAFGFDTDGNDHPTIWRQIQPFAWACLLREDESTTPSDDVDIQTAATALLERGGLNVP